MRYAYIIDNRVNQIIEEYDEDFPNIPINERYSPEIIKNLVEIPKDIEVVEGMDYIAESGEFKEHIEVVEEVEENENEGLQED